MWKQPNSKNLQRRSLQKRLSLLQSRNSIVLNASLLKDNSDTEYSGMEPEWWNRLNKDQRYRSSMVFPSPPEYGEVRSIRIEQSRRVVMVSENESSSEIGSFGPMESFSSTSPSFNFGKSKNIFFGKKSNAPKLNAIKNNLFQAEDQQFERADVDDDIQASGSRNVLNQSNRQSSIILFKDIDKNKSNKENFKRNSVNLDQEDNVDIGQDGEKIMELSSGGGNVSLNRSNQRSSNIFFKDNALNKSNKEYFSRKSIHNHKDNNVDDFRSLPHSQRHKSNTLTSDVEGTSYFHASKSMKDSDTDISDDFRPKKSIFRPRNNNSDRNVFTGALSYDHDVEHASLAAAACQSKVFLVGDNNDENDSQSFTESAQPRTTLFKNRNTNNGNRGKSLFVNAISYDPLPASQEIDKPKENSFKEHIDDDEVNNLDADLTNLAPRKTLFVSKNKKILDKKSGFANAISYDTIPCSQEVDKSKRDTFKEHIGDDEVINFDADLSDQVDQAPRKTLFFSKNKSHVDKKSGFANAISYDTILASQDVDKSKKDTFKETEIVDDEVNNLDADISDQAPRKTLFFSKNKHNVDKKSGFANAISYDTMPASQDIDKSKKDSFKEQTQNIEDDKVNNLEADLSDQAPRKTLFSSKNKNACEKKSVFADAISLDASVHDKSIVSQNHASQSYRSRSIALADKVHDNTSENHGEARKNIFKSNKADDNRTPMFAGAITYDASKTGELPQSQPPNDFEDDKLNVEDNTIQYSPYSIASDSVFYERIKAAASSTIIGGDVNRTPIRRSSRRSSLCQPKIISDIPEENETTKANSPLLEKTRQSKSSISNPINNAQTPIFEKSSKDRFSIGNKASNKSVESYKLEKLITNESTKKKSVSPILEKSNKSKTSVTNETYTESPLLEKSTAKEATVINALSPILEKTNKTRTSLTNKTSTYSTILKKSITNEATNTKLVSPILEKSNKSRTSITNKIILEKSNKNKTLIRNNALDESSGSFKSDEDKSLITNKSNTNSEYPILEKSSKHSSSVRNEASKKSRTLDSSILGNSSKIESLKSTPNASITSKEKDETLLQGRKRRFSITKNDSLNDLEVMSREDMSTKKYINFGTPEALLKLRSMRDDPENTLKVGKVDSIATPSPRRHSIRTWMKNSQSEDSTTVLNQSKIDRAFMEEMKAKRTNPPVRRSTIIPKTQEEKENEDSENEVSKFEDRSIQSRYPLRHSNIPVEMHAMIPMNYSEPENEQSDDDMVLEYVESRNESENDIVDNEETASSRSVKDNNERMIQNESLNQNYMVDIEEEINDEPKLNDHSFEIADKYDKSSSQNNMVDTEEEINEKSKLNNQSFTVATEVIDNDKSSYQNNVDIEGKINDEPKLNNQSFKVADKYDKSSNQNNMVDIEEKINDEPKLNQVTVEIIDNDESSNQNNVDIEGNINNEPKLNNQSFKVADKYDKSSKQNNMIDIEEKINDEPKLNQVTAEIIDNDESSNRNMVDFEENINDEPKLNHQSFEAPAEIINNDKSLNPNIVVDIEREINDEPKLNQVTVEIIDNDKSSNQNNMVNIEEEINDEPKLNHQSFGVVAEVVDNDKSSNQNNVIDIEEEISDESKFNDPSFKVIDNNKSSDQNNMVDIEEGLNYEPELNDKSLKVTSEVIDNDNEDEAHKHGNNLSNRSETNESNKDLNHAPLHIETIHRHSKDEKMFDEESLTNVLQEDESETAADTVNSTHKTILDMELTLGNESISNIEIFDMPNSQSLSISEASNRRSSAQGMITDNNTRSFSIDSLNRESSENSLSGLEFTTNIRNSRLPSMAARKSSIASDALRRKTFFFTSETYKRDNLKRKYSQVQNVDDKEDETEATNNDSEDDWNEDYSRLEQPSTSAQFTNVDNHMSEYTNVTEPKMSQEEIKEYMDLMNQAQEKQKKRAEELMKTLSKQRQDAIKLITKLQQPGSMNVFKKPKTPAPKKAKNNIANELKASLPVIKKRKLYMKEEWITTRLYDFVLKKLEPKYGIKTRNRSEKFIKDLASIVNEVVKSKKDYHIYVKTLKIEMARLKLVITHDDFHRFVIDYLPAFFRLKSIPACDRDVPKIEGSVYDHIRG